MKNRGRVGLAVAVTVVAVVAVVIAAAAATVVAVAARVLHTRPVFSRKHFSFWFLSLPDNLRRFRVMHRFAPPIR